MNQTCCIATHNDIIFMTSTEIYQDNKRADVSFVIINYNTKKLLEDLLNFFEVFEMPFSYSVIVVDNNSTDGSIELLTSRKGIKAIFNDRNEGYGRAANKGIAAAGSKYICILNTDLILNKEALLDVWNHMECAPETGVCSPVICYPDGRIQGFFFKFGLIFLYSDIVSKIYSKFKKLSISKAVSPLDVDGIRGAFIFLRSSVLTNRKLFDEDFFFYYEDTELAYRLKKRNVTAMVLPSSRIIHLGGQSSSRKNWKFFYSSKYLFIKKCYGENNMSIIYQMDRGKAHIRFAFYAVASLVSDNPRIKSKLDFYRNLSRGLSSLFDDIINNSV